jgi:manganese transport protein
MFIVKPDIAGIVKGFVPNNLFKGDKTSREMLYIAIGIIGATVMPHNLYLHSSLVQTRKINRSEEGIRAAIKFNLFDTSIALNLAFFVNAAILILAAGAFFKNGYFQVAEIQDAYKLLEHIFGSFAPVLFAIALIASGQSSTITGTLAGQIIMEGHINLRIEPWLRRLLTRLMAIVPAVFTIIYFGGNGLGNLIILSQVVLSLQLGFAVIPLIHFVSDKKRMGRFTIGPLTKILAWACAALILALNAKLIIDQISGWIRQYPNAVLWMYILVIPVTFAIALLLVYVFFRPLLFKHRDYPAQVPHGFATMITDLTPISYKNIGITIDFSKNDRDCIRHAIMQGGKHAHYTLIHVVETAAAQYYGTEVLDHETQSDADNLDKYVQSLLEKDYKAKGMIGFGSPAKSITQIVKDEKIDFLVMGSHGHKAFKDLIFGTTVNSVRHKVNIPVLVVKPQ